MRPFERTLIDLDSGAWGAISRVALGLVFLPAFRAIFGSGERTATFAVVFFGMLIALRVVPAVLRHTLPFSTEAKTVWADRRNIAKRYDSYQWQKLFWIGLGLLPYAVVGNGMTTAELVGMMICLIGGGAGLLLWRKITTALQPQ